MILELNRDVSTRSLTLGRLHVAELTVFTIERPWIPLEGSPGGTKGVSCVPVGRYKLFRHDSEAHPHTWALVNPRLNVYHWDTDVPDGQRGTARTLVLLHPANWAAELRGCIAPGLEREEDRVLSSVLAMHAIQAKLPWTNDHSIDIS